jgi:DNA repair protein RadD
MKYKLRPEYQVPCVDGVRNSYKKKKVAPLLVAPTGSGKTVIFSHIAENASEKNKRVLIMAHRKELCTQCGEKMMANEVDFGYINPKFTPDYRKMVQVGTIQSIVSRMAKMFVYGHGAGRELPVAADTENILPLEATLLYVPDLIIIDEAHRSLAPTYLKIIDFYKKHNPKLLILGVTASPVRGDGKPLSLLYDDIVLGPTVRKLIDLGFLVEPETYGAEVRVDLVNVDVDENGDYNQLQLSRVMNTGCITGDAVAHYTKICPGVPAVVFCIDVQHAINVAADFRAAGYLFEHIDGEMDDRGGDGTGTVGDNDRGRIIKRLRAGIIHGVTSVDLVTEGFDAPMVECTVLLRPTLSLALAIQMPGRGLRPYINPVTGHVKKRCFILDHANVSATLAQGTELLGFIDDDRSWTLEGVEVKKKKKKKGDVDKIGKVSQCPNCHRLHKAAIKCPNCGYAYKRATDITVVDGELIRLTRKRPELTEADTVALKQIAEDKGLPVDWALNIQAEWQERVESL